MRFNPIDAAHFAEFHKTFHGDTPETFAVCAKCGGACEYNKVGTLMPGEREYMAAAAGLSVTEFTARFLDVIVMEDGMELDVLRMTDGCPFLDRDTGACGCRRFKVVLCEIYPISFRVTGGRVEFKIDDWCPLADTLRFRRQFTEIGIPAVSRLPVPLAWYRHVAVYDELHFDYKALEAQRGADRSQPHDFTIHQLLHCQRAGLENDPKERFHPYPAEVVGRRHSGPTQERSGAPPGSALRVIDV